MIALDKFSETVGSKLGERAVALTTTAPFAYVAIALGVWLVDVGPVDGWQRLLDWVDARDASELIAVAVAASVLLPAVGSIVGRLAPQTIRLLEGYWPDRPRPLRSLRERRADQAWAERQQAVATVAGIFPAMAAGTASPDDEARLVRADLTRRRLPSRRAWTLPTRFGNRLRAAETRPWDKYRLDAIKVWPALWVVLPTSTRDEIIRARGQLDAALVGLVWCLLGVALGGLAWWAAPLAILAAWGVHRWWALPAVDRFADLLEAAFDIHRFGLYEAMRLPVPENAADEKATGERLTNFLWRGSDQATVAFETPDKAGKTDRTGGGSSGSPRPRPSTRVVRDPLSRGRRRRP